MARFLDKYVEAKRVTQAADIVSNMSTELGQSAFKWSKTADMAAATAGYQADAAVIRAKYTGDINDPGVKAHVVQSFDRDNTVTGLAVQRASFGMESSAQKARLEDRVQLAQNRIASEPDPVVRAKLQDDMVSDIKGTTAGGWLTPEEGRKFENTTLKNLDEERIRKLAESGNFAGARALATDPKATPNLDPLTRERLAEFTDRKELTAINRSYTQLARQDLIEKRTQAKIADDTMKDIRDKARAGTLTDSDLAHARPLIPDHQYEAAIKLRDQGPDTNSRGTVSAIVPLLHERDMTREIDNAFAAGQINKDTYLNLRSTNESYIKEMSPQDAPRRYRDEIRHSLDPANVGLNDKFSQSTAGLVQQGALEEFDTRIAALPVEKRKDAATVRQIANEIVDRESTSFVAQMRQGLPLPRAAGDMTRDAIDMGRLERMEQSTKHQFDAGQLSPDEYDLEINKLNRWRVILQKEQADAEKAKLTPKPGEKTK